MKILFFSTHDFEKNYLLKENKYGFDIDFISDPLNINTVSKAKKYEAICIFTCDDASKEVLIELSNYGIKFIAVRATGYDNIDLPIAFSLGLKVANVPEYSPNAIAEHTIGIALALNRKLKTTIIQMEKNDFSIDNLIGFDMNKKTVGVIGTGKIGRIVCKIFSSFGCKILANDITKNSKLEKEYNVKYTSLLSLCEESDIISIHTPLNEKTQHLIDEQLLSKMKNNVMIINTARGAIVNTEDLIQYLKSGKIGYYGADVYEFEKNIFFKNIKNEIIKDKMLLELKNMKNVLITPHQAFATVEALEGIAKTTFFNFKCWKNKVETKNDLFKMKVEINKV